jgi:hypothetical protein
MKKIIITLIALLPLVAIAQTTPEAIIGQCPDLPSVQALVINNIESEPPAEITNFREQIAKLREAIQKNEDQAITQADIDRVQSDAEKQAKQATGKSVAELQNMSEAEQEAMAQKMMAQKMSSSGMGNMSLADLQALEGKSNDEIMAAMGNKNVAIGGLTPQEIKAMEKMTDKQAEAYMKQGDRMQRVQAAAAGTPTVSQAETAAAGKQKKATEEQQKFTEQMSYITSLHEKERKEVADKLSEIQAKHKSTIDAAFDAMSPCMDGKIDTKKYTKEYCDAASKRYKAALIACETECFILWRNQISKEQGRYKTLLTDAKKVDALQIESANAQDKIKKSGASNIQKKVVGIGINTSMIVNGYINITENVMNY